MISEVWLGIFLALLIVAAILIIWPWNRKWRPVWIAHPYYGGGRVMLGRMTRKRAIKYVSQNFGAVMYVDDNHGFIFYKPHSGEHK